MLTYDIGMARASFIQRASVVLLIFFIATAGTTCSSSSRAVGHMTDTPSPMNPDQKPPTEESNDEPTDRPTETPSHAPTEGPTKIPTTRSSDAPPTGSPSSLPPSQSPSSVVYNADARTLSCYTFNMTNQSSNATTASLRPCHPKTDAYCLTYGTPASFDGGMIVGTCSPSNCLPILQTVQNVVFCIACQESGCNGAVASSESSDQTSSTRKSKYIGYPASVIAIVTLLLNRFLF